MPIDEQERTKRASEIAVARERVRQQGIALTKETEDLADRYIQGELTSEQFVEAGLKLYLPKAVSH